MTRPAAPPADRAAALRRAFDQRFAEPPQIDAVPTEDLLAIRIGSQNYAIQLSDVAGLFADKPITSVPGPLSALIGIAGLRGTIASVYDLHVLLGHRPAEKPKWLTVVPGRPLALAFEQFDGHLRVERHAIVSMGAHQHSRHVRDHIRIDDLSRPIIHLPSLLEEIEAGPSPRHEGEQMA